MGKIERIREYMGSHGAGYTLRRLWEKGSQRYLGTYDRKRKQVLCPPEELERQRKNPPEAGTISVVVPVYNTDPRMLRELTGCFEAQTYRDFEVVLYDGGSTKEETKAVLRELEARSKGDGSVWTIIWGKENQGISGNTNEAVKAASGEYIALCDHDDLIAPDALWRVAECIVREQPDMVYSDEDRVSEDGRSYMDPHYKPDFCPDTLCSDNYICHLMAMKKSLYFEAGGLRSGFDGSQDHDLTLRIAEKTRRICHLPYTLYSWRENFSSASHRDLQKCLESACRATVEHEAKAGRVVRAEPVGKEIRLWYEIPEGAGVEAIVHGATAAACEACFRELKERTGWERLDGRFVVEDGSGRIQEINKAAEESTAEYILLLDAGVRDVNSDFIREMMMYAQREDVAGVTGVLTDRKGKIVHGGYVLGVEGVAQCACEGMRDGTGAGYNAMRKAHNVSAVSIGCMLVKKGNWMPLDEGYRGGFAMADLGMRQRENGKWFVYTPWAKGTTEPSAMMLNAGKRKGNEDVAADMKRFEEKWGKEIIDPCYSPRFKKNKANYRW